MGRWAAGIVALRLAAAAGYVVGHLCSGTPSSQTQRLESRPEETNVEVTILRTDRRGLRGRLEQVAKEQERLAQENEALRTQQVIDQILTGRGSELPERPLK
jgi:enterochelin esterase-like enzyme